MKHITHLDFISEVHCNFIWKDNPFETEITAAEESDVLQLIEQIIPTDIDLSRVEAPEENLEELLSALATTGTIEKSTQGDAMARIQFQYLHQILYLVMIGTMWTIVGSESKAQDSDNRPAEIGALSLDPAKNRLLTPNGEVKIKDKLGRELLVYFVGINGQHIKCVVNGKIYPIPANNLSLDSQMAAKDWMDIQPSEMYQALEIVQRATNPEKQAQAIGSSMVGEQLSTVFDLDAKDLENTGAYIRSLLNANASIYKGAQQTTATKNGGVAAVSKDAAEKNLVYLMAAYRTWADSQGMPNIEIEASLSQELSPPIYTIIRGLYDLKSDRKSFNTDDPFKSMTDLHYQIKEGSIDAALSKVSFPDSSAAIIRFTEYLKPIANNPDHKDYPRAVKGLKLVSEKIFGTAPSVSKLAKMEVTPTTLTPEKIKALSEALDDPYALDEAISGISASGEVSTKKDTPSLETILRDNNDRSPLEQWTVTLHGKNIALQKDGTLLFEKPTLTKQMANHKFDANDICPTGRTGLYAWNRDDSLFTIDPDNGGNFVTIGGFPVNKKLQKCTGMQQVFNKSGLVVLNGEVFQMDQKKDSNLQKPLVDAINNIGTVDTILYADDVLVVTFIDEEKSKRASAQAGTPVKKTKAQAFHIPKGDIAKALSQFDMQIRGGESNIDVAEVVYGTHNFMAFKNPEGELICLRVDKTKNELSIDKKMGSELKGAVEFRGIGDSVIGFDPDGKAIFPQEIYVRLKQEYKKEEIAALRIDNFTILSGTQHNIGPFLFLTRWDTES